ncbi:Chromosomal replication initiator protein DnaA [hydrothermal vent metagenome]|uniref:Chromosomal replication initiator protein DnaA n=1 Tax=hydrothermal vent metagenome TaxID=652676 RepID=A0A3B0VQ19_9ZZZZ
MIWGKCLKRLESDLTMSDINIWLRPLQVVEGKTTLTIIASNDIIIDKIKENFLILINLALKEISDIDYNIVIILPQQNTSVIQESSLGSLAPVARPSNIDKRFTFDNFVEGSSNTIAKASALQVSQKLLTQFNPLLLYGSTGLGKTHLLHAIGNKILANDSSAIVCYVHSEQFVNGMINALRTGSITEFKNQYRSVSALLIDDIQFFAGKERTQEEFFHTFNSLLECKQRVIITCDKFPKEVNGLESRLKSRLGWGLSVCIDPPDFETRVAILQKKAVQHGFYLADDVAYYIAKKIKSNVRELEGALNTLWANSSFTHVDISLDFTKQTLKELFNIHHRHITVENIQKQTANYYNIKLSDLLSKKRTRSLVRPRQMGMFLAKELTDKSLPEIGEAFGGRDHTTVLYAHKKMKQLFDEEPEFLEDKQKLINLLTA